jgi:hypothetical protein
MLRLACLLLVTSAACGTDSAPGPGTSESPRPDAGPRGDGGAAGDGPAVDACVDAVQHSDFAWIQEHVLTPSCATAMCHAGAEPKVDLSLEAGQAYANLVDKGASTAAGWIRVVPGSPEQSYLMVAFGRAPGPMPRDGFMPLGAPPLCGPKLDAVARWISAGAPM